MEGRVGVLRFVLDKEELKELATFYGIPEELIYYDVKAIVRTDIQRLLSMMVTGQVVEDYWATLRKTSFDNYRLIYRGHVVKEDTIDVYLALIHNNKEVYNEKIGIIKKEPVEQS